MPNKPIEFNKPIPIVWMRAYLPKGIFPVVGLYNRDFIL